MDLADGELETIADDLGVDVAALQSEAVKDCAESIVESRDVEKSTAFAICQDMANEGRLQSPPHVALAEQADPGRIERTEESGAVRYTNIKLLGTGVWGDSGSGRHFLYSARTTRNLADNVVETTLNLFHERENEVTDVGDLDPESLFIGDDDDGLYGDIVLHMDNAASEFADEALQNALETDGAEGLKGPSLEIAGQEYEFDRTEGVHELVEGRIIGVALVGLGVSPGPGSKDAAFAEQTRERAVALASNDGASVLTKQTNEMKLNALRERLESIETVQLSDDADEDELRELAAAFDIELQEDDEDEEESEEEEDMDDEEEGDDVSDDDEEDTDVDIDLADVAERVDSMAEQVQANAERIEALAETTETLSEQTLEIREADLSLSELAERTERVSELADTVTELSDTVEAIAEEPEEPTSLASMGGAEVNGAEDGEQIFVDFGTTETNREY